MASVKELYDEATKLSDSDREALTSMLIDTLAPYPPNTFSNQAELEDLLLEGMKSPRQLVTPETWNHAHAELERRLKKSAA
jgi:hypothetical protein